MNIGSTINAKVVHDLLLTLELLSEGVESARQLHNIEKQKHRIILCTQKFRCTLSLGERTRVLIRYD